MQCRHRRLRSEDEVELYRRELITIREREDPLWERLKRRRLGRKEARYKKKSGTAAM